MSAARRLLYYAPRSAPSRAVLMVAKYLNVDLQLRLVRLDKSEHKTPEFLKVSAAVRAAANASGTRASPTRSPR